MELLQGKNVAEIKDNLQMAQNLINTFPSIFSEDSMRTKAN